MTSKNLCFKLMKEDLKRRIWVIALFMLSFFFSVVMPVIFICSEKKSDYSTPDQWISYVENGVLEILGAENPFVIMILIVASIVCAVSGFSYLHSAKKVDLYHSLPVKRGTLFLAQYLNGIGIVAVIYLAALACGVVASVISGIEFSLMMSVVMSGFAFHMAYFCLMYTVMTVAMLMTGNIIIALMGNAVFCFYGPAVASLISGYVSTWFETYSSKSFFLGEDFFEMIMTHTSPFVHYMIHLEDLGNDSLLATILWVLAITAVLVAFCWWLCGKRPSEAASRAMAFSQSRTPIKILLVIPVALVFGLFFWHLRDTMGWAIFGIICGGILSHCLLEIIYHFDFRKLFSNRLHLLICIAVSCFVLCGFRYDWFGYDSYLPKGSQVQSASITIPALDDWITYGEVEEETLMDGNFYFQWRYESAVDYTTEHMELTDLADILSIAQTGISLNKEEGKGDWDYDPGYRTYTIQYRLNNGRTITRRYELYGDQVREEVERIFETQEYKTGTFPVLTQSDEEIARINIQQFNHIAKVEADSVQRSELLEAYQEDLKELTMETRRQEIPVATIQFVTQNMNKALYEYGAGLDENEYRYRVYNISDRCYYPVYPSFTRTLETLKELGSQVAIGVPADRINKIIINNYNQLMTREETHIILAEETYEDVYYKDGEAAQITTLEDRESIAALAPALMPHDYGGMNSVSEIKYKTGMTATVYIETDSGEKTIECNLDESALPDRYK